MKKLKNTKLNNNYYKYSYRANKTPTNPPGFFHCSIAKRASRKFKEVFIEH
jgi:hypothetical protein